MFQYTEKQFFCNTVKEEIVYILKRKNYLKRDRGKIGESIGITEFS